MTPKGEHAGPITVWHKADAQLTDLMRIAAKAEAFVHMCVLLTEQETLELDLLRLRKSKAADVDFKRVHLDARLQAVRDMITRLRQRHQ